VRDAAPLHWKGKRNRRDRDMTTELYKSQDGSRELILNRVGNNDYRITLASAHRCETIKRMFYLEAAQRYIRSTAALFGMMETWN
jgi:hypothetical protein